MSISQIDHVRKAQSRAIAEGKLVETINSLSRDTFVSKYITQQRLENTGRELVDLVRRSTQLIHAPHVEFLYASSLKLNENKFILDACFKLIEESSAADYKASEVRWSPASKRREMVLPDMKYFVISSSAVEEANVPTQVLGFVSFMVTYEDGYEVIYVYEIHLDEQLRGQGIGAVLMNEVESIGQRVGVEKCMLTVFRSNKKAVRWYERLGYSVDDFSPGPRVLRNGTVKEPSYTILSKSLMAS